MKLKTFDDYEISLGDIMRGERATLGKSLLDVQRELRIKAAYIAAIEDANPAAFDTPGFIPGYVRSYARFLRMDPDEAFEVFCAESGFVAAHGMMAEASVRREEYVGAQANTQDVYNPFTNPKTPFIPTNESWMTKIQYNAVASIAILVLLIGAIGYGGVSILREIQRVEIASIDQVPIVLSELDPLQSTGLVVVHDIENDDQAALEQQAKLDRLYRPKALHIPVLVQRDGPISTLDPSVTGAFAVPKQSQEETVAFVGSEEVEVPMVVEAPLPELALFAIRPAWVRVRAADGNVIFEKILDAGEEYKLPQTEVAPSLRAGMSGSLYFKVNGKLFGPAGVKTSTVKNVALSIEAVRERYAEAKIDEDPVLARIIAMAKSQAEEPPEE